MTALGVSMDLVPPLAHRITEGKETSMGSNSGKGSRGSKGDRGSTGVIIKIGKLVRVTRELLADRIASPYFLISLDIYTYFLKARK